MQSGNENTPEKSRTQELILKLKDSLEAFKEIEAKNISLEQEHETLKSYIENLMSSDVFK
ncbi:hypothetical protein BB561_000217 [Smittium simulii]|uniref:Uncharacterized protein n=1 Tax=Smittium simulii TaxID=133385 RepID=A0A2T9Z076_9FUNG|nr:hypothetical protein BB561_000217 [Smittium simulii]